MHHTIDLNAPSQPLHHHWSECVGAGRAAETLRSDWREQLSLAQKECGYRRIRFHGLLHDDMFLLHRMKDGAFHFNWQYIDAVFDHLVDLGVEPFIELGFCPGAIARERETVFWWKGHGAPPIDPDTWCRLLRELAQHLLQRYGNCVESWYWEVWNEPNHHCFFKGSRPEYFELYKISVQTLKAVCPTFRVGGPATANFVPDDRFVGEEEDVSLHANHTVPDDRQDDLQWRGVWIEEFLVYAAEHQLPVDFLSFHPYPMDWASDGQGGLKNYFRGLGALRDDLAWGRNVLKESAFPNAEIHCTEWNTSSAFSDLVHDELASATYAVATNAMAAGLADSVSWWTFTDIFEEQGGQASIFHGGFGQINAQGLPKPLFHAYRFLHRLGCDILSQNEQSIATRLGDGGLSLLLWNYPEEAKGGLPLVRDSRKETRRALEMGETQKHHLSIQGLRPHEPLVLERLDPQHGCVVDAWLAWGAPDPPSREQVDLLRRMAHPSLTSFSANASGRLELNVEMAPWALAQLRSVAPGGTALESMPTVATQPMEE